MFIETIKPATSRSPLKVAESRRKWTKLCGVDVLAASPAFQVPGVKPQSPVKLTLNHERAIRRFFSDWDHYGGAQRAAYIKVRVCLGHVRLLLTAEVPGQTK